MLEGHPLETKSWLPDLPCSPLNERPGQRTKLALIGASMLGDDPPPLDDSEWDVWGCNSLWRRHLDSQGRFRADDWFEMHPLSVQTAQEHRDMTECPVNLYVLGETFEYNWTTYPLDKVREYFGPRDYFTVTFAYQIALALMNDYEEIGLYGVELWQGSVREMRVELPCLNYWLGVAFGQGTKITLPSYSKLLYHEQLYGYDYEADVRQSGYDDAAIASRWHREQEKRNQDWRPSPLSQAVRLR